MVAKNSGLFCGSSGTRLQNMFACATPLGNISSFVPFVAAQSIWDHGREKSSNTYFDFEQKISQSDLNVFGFNEDILMDLWGICDDGKKGRFQGNQNDKLPPGVKEFNENY